MNLRDIITLIEAVQTKDRTTAFETLADEQRGEPEHAMLVVQHVNGGGVLGPVVEHVGDLTHRMAQHPDREGYLFGYELVQAKVEKCLSFLESSYGFEREHRENITNNAEYKGVSVEDFEARLDKALARYADAHSKLKVWNQAQYLAREAAVALGRKNWQRARDCLRGLDDHLGSPEQWIAFAGAFDPDFGK